MRHGGAAPRLLEPLERRPRTHRLGAGRRGAHGHHGEHELCGLEVLTRGVARVRGRTQSVDADARRALLADVALLVSEHAHEHRVRVWLHLRRLALGARANTGCETQPAAGPPASKAAR